MLTICSFIAGQPENNNAFPDLASMEGSLRTYKTEVRDKVCQRIREISTDIATAMECTAEVEFNWRDEGYPPVVNHALQTQYVKRVATRWFGPQHLSEEDLPLTASEDFAYFV